MPSDDDEHTGEGQTARWPRPVIAPTRLESASLYTYVLDADSDLAEEFDIRSLVAARQLATARVLAVSVGECDLAPWFDATSRGLGVLILEGVVAIETLVGDRTALELVGAGDLLQFPNRRTDDLLERSYGWRVLCPTQLALLDAEFADRVRPWPQLVQALLRRVVRRTADVDALRAITCQPRLEVRLVLLLWHLAARWGRVERSGIRVTLPLTHRLLGQLVGAERPSISHALSRLAHAGLVTGTAGDLHLNGTLDRHLEILLGRANSLRAQGLDSRSEPQRIA
jgi:CRP-like cAMP-binding protein